MGFLLARRLVVECCLRLGLCRRRLLPLLRLVRFVLLWLLWCLFVEVRRRWLDRVVLRIFEVNDYWVLCGRGLLAWGRLGLLIGLEWAAKH